MYYEDFGDSQSKELGANIISLIIPYCVICHDTDCNNWWEMLKTSTGNEYISISWFGFIWGHNLESTLGCFAAKFSLKTPSIDNH